MKRHTAPRNRSLVLGALVAGTSVVTGGVILLSNQTIQIVAGVAGLLLLFVALVQFSAVPVRTIATAFWILLIAHRAFILRVEAAPMSLDALQNNLVEVIITVFLFLCSLLLGLAGLRTPRDPVRLRVSFWLFIYIGVACVSLSWTPNPAYASFWIMRLFAAAALITVCLRGADEASCRSFATATLIGMLPYIALPVVAAYVGSVSVDLRTNSFWLHPDSAGIIGFAVAMVFLLKALQDRSAPAFALGMASLMSAFLAAGKSGAVGAAAALLVLFGVRRRLWIKTSSILVVLLVAIVALLQRLNLEIGLFAHWNYYWEEYRLGTLYGRFDLWLGTIQVWLQSGWSVLVGYGFAATSTLGLKAASGAFVTSHAHNSFLQVLVEMGPAGLLPFLMIIGTTTMGAVRYRGALHSSPALPLLCGWVVLITSSVTNTVFGGVLTPQFYLFIGLSATIERMWALHRWGLADAPARTMDAASPERMGLVPGSNVARRDGPEGRLP